MQVQGEGAQGLGRLVNGQEGSRVLGRVGRAGTLPRGLSLSDGTAAPPPSANVYRETTLPAR